MKKFSTFLIGFLTLFFLAGTLLASDFKILSTKGKVEVSRDQKSWSGVKAPAKISSGTCIMIELKEQMVIQSILFQNF